MKKVNLTIGCATLAIFALMSCTKQTLTTPTEYTAPNAAISLASKPHHDKVEGHSAYFDDGKQPGVDHVDYGCKGSSGNCLNSVTITASALVVIDSLIHESGAGDNSGVISTVTNNYDLLQNYIPYQLLDGIENGDLILRTRGNISTSSAVYFLFYDTATAALENAQPLTL